MLGTTDDQREDVVQETFIRLHRQVSTHGWGSIKHPTTWLFQVAHNLTMDVLRQRRRRQDACSEYRLQAVRLKPELRTEPSQVERIVPLRAAQGNDIVGSHRQQQPAGATVSLPLL